MNHVSRVLWNIVHDKKMRPETRLAALETIMRVVEK